MTESFVISTEVEGSLFECLVWEFSTSFRYARNDREFLSSRPKWRDLFWNFYLVWDFSASLRYARNDREFLSSRPKWRDLFWNVEFENSRLHFVTLEMTESFCHLNRSGGISFWMLSFRILDFTSLRSKWQRVLSSRPKRRDLFLNVEFENSASVVMTLPYKYCSLKATIQFPYFRGNIPLLLLGVNIEI